jgi:putative nucleotidyltransferase with HDIG domain
MSDTRTLLARMLQQLAAALRAATLYPPGHPSIHTPLVDLTTGFGMLLRDRDKVALGIVDDVLILDEMPFYDAPSRFRAVFDALESRQLESILFQPGLTSGELASLLQVLAPRGEDGERPAWEAARNFEMPHIVLRERIDDSDDPRALARRTYERTLAIVVDLVSEIRTGRIPASGQATQVVNTMRDLVLADESALLGLALLKSYDDYTYTHSVNVAIFSLAFGRFLGLEGRPLERVGLAGLLHDLGKVRTAESIIKKPGTLTSEEIRIMQRHPELGAEIVEEMKGIDSETGRLVLHHHVRHDGTGYPRLRAGQDVHPHGQIVAIADCYDALTTTRSYQKARHPSEAVRLLRRLGGTAYEAERTEAFVEMIGAYPVGELVRLSTNELAVVSRSSDLDATAPRVRIVTSSSGISLPQPIDCDLSAEPAGGRLIAGIADPLRKGIDVVRVLGL